MKKVAFLFLTSLFIYTQTSFAQEAGLIRLGGGLAMGTKMAIDDNLDDKLGFGITITGDYFITDKIAVAAGYSFYFKSKVGDPSSLEVAVNGSTLDIDGKYFFLTDNVKLYGLFGVGVGFAKAEVTFDIGAGPQSESSSDSEVGLNIGGGANFYLSDSMYLNGLLKYNSAFEQLAIDLGIGFNIN